ncbi:hypothetical protein OPV22_012338 [Ensete ventricosum]|uniref:Uncharacterized protein n=1 Tax=Ensete ventricosum TaxID=4639 RepID=A0AAV8R6U8_ENSVE|nr:hypothetical protein OPV22_012338 [Ensete ventricosum]
MSEGEESTCLQEESQLLGSNAVCKIFLAGKDPKFFKIEPRLHWIQTEDGVSRCDLVIAFGNLMAMDRQPWMADAGKMLMLNEPFLASPPWSATDEQADLSPYTSI